MTRKQKTLKAFAHLCADEFAALKNNLLQNGYSEKRIKNAESCFTVYAKYWRGEWAGASKEVYARFYK